MTPHQRAGIVRLLADAFAASPKMTRIALYTDDTGLRKLRYPCSDRTPPSHLLRNGQLFTLRSITSTEKVEP